MCSKDSPGYLFLPKGNLRPNSGTDACDGTLELGGWVLDQALSVSVGGQWELAGLYLSAAL